MFRALAAGALIVASFSMRTDTQQSHAQTWSNATNLTDAQNQWNQFFRHSIKAIGDSETKEVSTSSDGAVSFRYLDTTNDNDATVAWEVTGNNDTENRKIEKILQVKTIVDPSNPKISTITKTTFQKENIINLNKKQSS